VRFLGFCKINHAKKLAQESGAVRLTHDKIMRQHFGRPQVGEKRNATIRDLILSNQKKQ